MYESYWRVDLNLEVCRRLDITLTYNGTIKTNNPETIMSNLNDLVNGVYPRRETVWTQDGPVMVNTNINYVFLEILLKSPRFGYYRVIPRHVVVTSRIERIPDMEYTILGDNNQALYHSAQGQSFLAFSNYSYYMIFPTEIFWTKNHCNELYYGLCELGIEPQSYIMGDTIDDVELYKVF